MKTKQSASRKPKPERVSRKPQPAPEPSIQDELAAATRRIDQLSATVRQLDQHIAVVADRTATAVASRGEEIIQRMTKLATAMETAAAVMASRMAAQNNQITNAGIQFKRAIDQWVPVKWSSLPLWLDGIDQLVRQLNTKVDAAYKVLHDISYSRKRDSPKPLPEPAPNGSDMVGWFMG